MKLVSLILVFGILLIGCTQNQQPIIANETVPDTILNTNETVSDTADKEIPDTVLDKYEELTSLYGNATSLSFCPGTAEGFESGYLIENIQGSFYSTDYYDVNGKLLISSTNRVTTEESPPRIIMEDCTVLTGHELYNSDEQPFDEIENEEDKETRRLLGSHRETRPIGLTCTDSDGGQRHAVRGVTASFNSTARIAETKTDSCLANFLLERYCRSNNTIGTELYQCPHGCTDGACNPEPPEPPVTCTDSDGGIKYFINGTIRRGTREIKDYCVLNYLTEYYCENNTIQIDFETCTNGCSNGRCRVELGAATSAPMRCRDSDGGAQYALRGTINYTYVEAGSPALRTTTRTDYCEGDYVNEYACRSDNTTRLITLRCTNGCSNGACNIDVPSVPGDSIPTADSVVTFESATGKRKLLIINDLNPTSAYENWIVSVHIGQTQSSLSFPSTEILQSSDYVCPNPDTLRAIPPYSALRTTDPSELTDPELDSSLIGFPFDTLSYRYFTIPDSWTTPYYIRVWYGNWVPGYSPTTPAMGDEFSFEFDTELCYSRALSQARNCTGSTVYKAIDLPITAHDRDATLAIRMSGFVPDGEFYRSSYCALYGG